MDNRKIGVLGKKSLAKILANEGVTSINQLGGYLDLLSAWNRYNKTIDNRRKTSKTFLKTTATLPITEQKIKTTIPKLTLSKLGGFVTNLNKGKNGAFGFTLVSGTTGAKLDLKFNQQAHFDKWFEKVQRNESGEESNSQGDESIVFYGVFSGLIFVENFKILRGGCNKHASCDKTIKASFYTFDVHNPSSQYNNCFLKSLQHLTKICIDNKQIRKDLKLVSNSMITIADAYKIINHLNCSVQIIDYDTNEILDPDVQYILLKDEHYYAVNSFTENNRVSNKTKRGLLAFDFETRPTEDFNLIKATGQKMFILKDSICSVYHRQYFKTETNSQILVSDEENSSARKFINFLNQEAKANRSYNVIAHNGGRFDFYFIIACLTEKELLECKIQMRGLTVIAIDYRGNLFKDSACFLTDTLEKLSESFKINDGKIGSCTYNGQIMTSMELCMYKIKLTFAQFMRLQQDEPEFWQLYEKYCMYDSIAIFQIWEKFTICVNGLVGKINPYLLRSCPLMSCSTIGSHSKKILVELNKFKGQDNFYKKDISLFTGVTYEGKDKKIDYEKYKFLTNFKRGGISHCHQAGKHMSGITGVDIASQYPASLIHSMVPLGKSFWLEKKDVFDSSLHGFYLLNNLVFNSKHTLKPVAQSIDNCALKWNTNTIDELFVDSYMIEYLIENYGLSSYTITKALVGTRQVSADKIFGKYVQTFYDEKKNQDDLKALADKEYNPALRTTIKLYLNSLTGKLVEDPSVHFSLQLNAVSENDSSPKLNGVSAEKVFNDDKINEWLITGIMVYSYSKRLLFEYIKCLPNDSSDVIHIETDGIYFSTRHLEQFTNNLIAYKGEYPCKMGEDLGNLKIEKSTHEGQVAYFLGKKFYCITTKKDNIFRIKGIPKETILADGSPDVLVDVDLYEDVYKGEEIKRTFITLKKNFFVEKTNISVCSMTRTIKPNMKYSSYE